MSRKRLALLAVAVTLAIVVAYQTVASAERAASFVAQADAPAVAPGVDVLAGMAQIPLRVAGSLPPNGVR